MCPISRIPVWEEIRNQLRHETYSTNYGHSSKLLAKAQAKPSPSDLEPNTINTRWLQQFSKTHMYHTYIYPILIQTGLGWRNVIGATGSVPLLASKLLAEQHTITLASIVIGDVTHLPHQPDNRKKLWPDEYRIGHWLSIRSEDPLKQNAHPKKRDRFQPHWTSFSHQTGIRCYNRNTKLQYYKMRSLSNTTPHITRKRENGSILNQNCRTHSTSLREGLKNGTIWNVYFLPLSVLDVGAQWKP